MKVRIGPFRALVAVLWAMLLVVPVGVVGPQGPRPASVGEALAELAGGSLGIGVLSALVVGGELMGAAVVRLVLVVAATVAFWLTGHIRPHDSAPQPPRRRRCAECGAWASTAMKHCPGCGRPLPGSGAR